MDSFLEQTAPGVAYTEIKKMIMLKRLTPGQRLAEISLSQEIGVSRTPVREALLELQKDGYVSFSRGKGVQVVPPTRCARSSNNGERRRRCPTSRRC